MASRELVNEKPNLRPNKRVAAGGKTLFLHHTPDQRSTRSYIQATWNGTTKKRGSSIENMFGIDQPGVEYSLNKRQRWTLLQELRNNDDKAGSSSNDSDLEVQSDDEQMTKKSTRRKKKAARHREKLAETTFRLFELQDTGKKANCVSIISNKGPNRVKLPQKTYMTAPIDLPTIEHQENANTNRTTQEPSVDVTYFAVLPAPRGKKLTNVRRHRNKQNKATSNVQRPEANPTANLKVNESNSERRKPVQKTVVESDDDEQNEDEDEDEDDEDDEDDRDWTTEIQYGVRPNNLILDDFIPTIPKETSREQTRKISERLVVVDKPSSKSSRFYLEDLDKIDTKRPYRRQISKEEKLYNRDLAIYQQTKKTVINVERTTQQKMTFRFRSIFLKKTDLDTKFLSENYGKNLVHAHCYPKTFLIRLDDKLFSMNWPQKPESFRHYVTLNSYLIIIEDESTNDENDFQRVQVAINIDLNCSSIEIENLFESATKIYRLSEVVDRTLSFLSSLPFDVFKPIDYELTRKRIVRTKFGNDLSDTEHLNNQLLQLKIFDKKSISIDENKIENLQFSETNSLNDFELLKPDVCTICYRDIDSNIPVTALKSCAHWLCNDCWKNYLENSVQRFELIRCPEWNCDSVVDIGTFLLLTNVRSMKIYERNIENCLVNVSRSYVKCPAKNCPNIVQLFGSSIDHARCPCSREFCAQCKEEPHFPANCRAYRFYIEELHRNGDGIITATPITHVQGRNCVSCNNFIEKNGGCNHMTCRCGAQFCWSCTAYWQDHYKPDGEFKCPRESVALQQEAIQHKKTNAKRHYYDAVFHRYERILQNQMKFRENANRLLNTIPFEKTQKFDPTLIEKQIGQRESLLRHLLEKAKYIQYLHRVCEFVAVAADGYGNTPGEFRNSLQILENFVLSMSQAFEGGRGHQAIQQINECHDKAEKVIERLQNAVQLRELRRAETTGYVTS